MATFTHRQGQFLAFIYWYTKLHLAAEAVIEKAEEAIGQITGKRRGVKQPAADAAVADGAK